MIKLKKKQTKPQKNKKQGKKKILFKLAVLCEERNIEFPS
jgi:hypothetical protein